jgi:hypothetical protein
MPRPKSKTELINLSNQNFNQLTTFINSLNDTQQLEEFPEGTLNRNIRDVLTHLHHWHLLMIEWYQLGMNGQKPEMPTKGYTWKATPELNKWINQHYQKISLAESKQMVKTSFDSLQLIIEKHSDDELYAKKMYKWTGTTSLAAYLISATSSHYDWGLKLIKKCRKNIAKNISQ